MNLSYLQPALALLLPPWQCIFCDHSTYVRERDSAEVDLQEVPRLLRCHPSCFKSEEMSPRSLTGLVPLLNAVTLNVFLIPARAVFPAFAASQRIESHPDVKCVHDV